MLGPAGDFALGTASAPAPGDPPGPALGLGDLLIADAAIAGDGTSRALGAEERVAGDGELCAAICAADPRTRRGLVFSTDLFHGLLDDDGLAGRVRSAGAAAVEMEGATLFQLGVRRRVAIGCVLVVADVITEAGRVRIEDEELEAACAAAGRLGAAGLGVRS